MKKRHSAEQIVAKLREANGQLGKGLRVPEVCKHLGGSEQTYYRWRCNDTQLPRHFFGATAQVINRGSNHDF